MTMFQKYKPVPFVFMVVSVLYFFYVVSLGSSTMIGDEIGGDPGGMLLPLVLSIFMFIASSIIFLTDKRAIQTVDQNSDRLEHRLFYLTVIITILYVVAMRPLGFILTSVLLLYTLTFFYLKGSVHSKDFGMWAVGLIASLLVILTIYTIGRKLTRYLLLAARSKTIPQWFGSTTVTVSLVLLITFFLYILFSKLVKKRLMRSSMWQSHKIVYTSGMLSVFTTELLYVVFKQMFLVELVKGIIYW